MNVLAASLIVRLKFGPKIGLRTVPNGLYATFLHGDLNATLDLVSDDTEWIVYGQESNLVIRHSIASMLAFTFANRSTSTLRIRPIGR